MGKPATTVEIAFNAGVGTPAVDRVWTDVSSYVRQVDGLTISRGRADETSTVEPSTLSLVLDNRDGRFTPERTSSPYYPNVKLGRPIRVTATPSGQAASVRFVGYIDQWPVQWPNAVDDISTVAITARSRLSRLALSAPMRSIVEEEFLYLADASGEKVGGPILYYPLGEPEGATEAGNIGTETTAETLAQIGSGTAVSFGVNTGPGTDGMSAPQFGGGKYLSRKFGFDISGATYFAIEAFFNISAAPASAVTIAAVTDESGTEMYRLAVLPTGEVEYRIRYSQAASDFSFASGLTVTDGATHHALLRVINNGVTAVSYLDGDWLSDASGVDPWDVAVRRLVVGGGAGLQPFTGTISHVAVFNSDSNDLSDARVADHWAAGTTGFSGERSDQRVHRLADYAGIPAVEWAGDTGASVSIAHFDTTDLTPLDAMRKVEATESGLLFDARNGDLAFHARSRRYNAAVALTLDVTSGQVALGAQPVLDDLRIVNDVEASRSEGAVQRVTDATSVTDHGPRRETLDLVTTSDTEVTDAANWLVSRYAHPKTRIDSLSVDLWRHSDSFQASLLSLDIGSRISVTNLPSQAPSSSMDLFVEGTEEQIDASGYRITYAVSPAAQNDVWQLDSATYSVLDTSTIPAY